MDLEDGNGTFIKIEKLYPLINGSSLSFGDSYIVVNMSASEKGKFEKISIKFLKGEKANQIL